MNQPDWQQVARAVRLRRAQRNYRSQEAAARAAGIGVQTWRQIERGKKDHYTMVILVAVARTLEWPDDMLPRIAAGETPEVVGPPGAGERRRAHDRRRAWVTDTADIVGTPPRPAGPSLHPAPIEVLHEIRDVLADALSRVERALAK